MTRTVIFQHSMIIVSPGFMFRQVTVIVIMKILHINTHVFHFTAVDFTFK